MDWKVIAALVVAVAIVVSGFMASGGINLTGTGPVIAAPGASGENPIGDFLTGAKDAVSNLLSIPTEKNINRTLQVSGSLSSESDVLRLNTPANYVEIIFNAPSSVNVGSEKVDFPEGANASVGNFSGKLDIYANGTIMLDGNAEMIYASNIGILSHAQKAAPVKVSTSVKSIKVYNASADLSMSATGSLNIGQDKVAIKLYSEPVMIQNFKGNLDMSGASLALDGLSTKVLISSKEKISVG